MTNTYITNSKAQWIRRACKDFKEISGIEHLPWTRKNFFYFFEHRGKKYVHKDALRFVYTNADTYSHEREPDCCPLVKEINPIDVIEFLETTTSELFPPLIESNDKFLVYEYVQGTPATDITAEEFFWIKEQHNKLSHTPFTNSMTYNLVRADQLKLVDLKHFEAKSLPFFVYFYNKENNINSLYLDNESNCMAVFEHLRVDYPVDSAIIYNL
jgi:hypothetical protein